MGVALITEFYDHNIVEVVLIFLMMIIGRIHTQGLCINIWGLGAGGIEESLAEGRRSDTCMHDVTLNCKYR